MDPRGSGKSTILDCGVSTRDPNFEYSMDPAQIESCAIDLESKFGDLAAFSPTSAAHDLFNLISKLSNGARTFVYGSDYEAIMVERLMHLAPPEVTGYILDSPVSTTGVYNYFTDFDDIVDEVARTLMERCDHDRVCSSHFKEPDTLIAVFQDVLTAFDDQPGSACFEIINTMNIMNQKWPASHKLRKLISSLVISPWSYMTIPQLVYRLKRCQPHDVDVLTSFIDNLLNQGLLKNLDSSGQSSEMLYFLIIYSELWERPTPSVAELKKRFTDTVGGWGIYADVKLYCAFSKEQSKVCDRYSFGKYGARGINYKHDRYWNASVTIPSQASVLVMSSKMDMFSPIKYAKSLFESLISKHKELITFQTGSSPMFLSTHLQLRYLSGDTCASKIIASYIRSDGDLTGLDKSCLDEMPTFQMIPSDFNEANFTNSPNFS
ncbi:putative alpha/Beta hydrolase [Plasmopara halstedii]